VPWVTRVKPAAVTTGRRAYLLLQQEIEEERLVLTLRRLACGLKLFLPCYFLGRLIRTIFRLVSSVAGSNFAIALRMRSRVDHITSTRTAK
jgi:hypothetical protein